MSLIVNSTTGQSKAIKLTTPPTLIYNADEQTFEVWKGESLVRRVEIDNPRTLKWLEHHLPDDAEWHFGRDTNGNTYLLDSEEN